MKKVIILIGPKGSGKTYIGTLLSMHFPVHFLKIEPIFKRIRGDREVTDETYISEGFDLVTGEINRLLTREDVVCFESTGLTDQFRTLLSDLRAKFAVVLIKIAVSPELCISRIRERESEEQVHVSEHLIKRINYQSEQQLFSYDFVIENEKSSDEDLLLDLQQFIHT